MDGQKLGWTIVSIAIGSCVALLWLSEYSTTNAQTTVVKFPTIAVNRIQSTTTATGAQTDDTLALLPVERVQTLHIPTPDSVRGMYMSAWVAGTDSARNRLVKTALSENINALVIDIKDATGYISYTGTNPEIKKRNSYGNRIRNMSKILADLHKKNIYVIGRISVFQDTLAAKYMPDQAVQSKKGGIWKDRKGLSWMDESSKKHWDYTIAIAREAYEIGFDEINFDYVRFPTDGVASDMVFPVSGKNPDKSAVIASFFEYASAELRDVSGIPLSADVFGLTTTAADTDGIGIGQRWVDIIPFVDFLCPMIYPSHYAPHSFGFKNPADHPYEVIKRALQGAIDKNESIGEPITKIRPWIQDFDMGANYDKEKIQDQIAAGQELGIESYLAWDPSNRYTVGGYKQ